MISLKLKELLKILPAFVVSVACGSLIFVSQASAAVVNDGGGGGGTVSTPSTSTNYNCGYDSRGLPVSPSAVDQKNCVVISGGPSQINTTNVPLITKYLNPFIKLLTVIVGLAVTFGIIYGGIEYSMSAGDPQKAQKGRKHIQNAALALVTYALIIAFLNFLIPGGVAV